MGLAELLEKRIVLVAGEGGVGRTTMVAAIALQAAKLGKRVLVAEDNADYSALAVWSRSFTSRTHRACRWHLGHTTLVANGSGAVSRERTSQRRSRTRGPWLRRARAVSLGSSFVREMGVFYHLLTLLNAKRPDGSHEHELIVVDMPATGHALALTGLPDVLLRLVSRGPIYDALKQGQAYLNDPKSAAADVGA